MVIPKIKECLPLVNGLWAHINYQFPNAFNITSSQLDIVFLSNWSQRLSAPILRVIHNDESTYMMNDTELTTLAEIIKGMYKHRWDKLMDVALQEYDPIHNYYDQLTESITYSETGEGSKDVEGEHANTRTDNLTKAITDTRSETETIATTDTTTDTRQILETRNLQDSGTNSVDNGIYGFNSANSVGDTDSSGSTSNRETGTVTTAHSGTLADVKGGTITNAHSGGTSESNTGTQANAGTDSTSETTEDSKEGERARSYTKTGNIGNISTQKLLGEELELWQYNFLYEIMRDVINFISLPTYETEKM